MNGFSRFLILLPLLGDHGVVLAAAISPAEVQLSVPASAEMNLAEELRIPVRLRAGSSVSVSIQVQPEELSGEVASGEVKLEAVPDQLELKAGVEASIELRVTTNSSAPSFAGKRFGITAFESGAAAGQAHIPLAVNAVYVVKVIDGDPFNFSTPDEVVRFVPHPEGLQFLFQNFSSRSCVIHAEGPIEHQDTESPLRPALRGAGGELVLDPQGTYAPPRILPYAGRDFAGSYTIHDVYHPTRQVLVNVTESLFR